MMYFWVRVTKDLHHRRLFLFFGDEGDYNYFKSRQGYPCWFSETPDPHGPSWWTLHEQSGTTEFEKKTEAKKAAIHAAMTAGWVVVEETYETQAFYNV
jgi:hypothetical protein